MNNNRRIHLLVALILLAGSIAVFTPTADAVTIHVLVVIDGLASNFEQHETSKMSMELLLRKIKRKLRCDVQISHLDTKAVGSMKASGDNILSWISTVGANKDDVVWVYYSGHGGVHPGTDNFYLSLPGEKFSRNRLVQRMEGLRCRLKILMTDACSYSGDRIVNNSPPGKIAYRHLFYEHKGFLNVVAAAKGELAGGSPDGGWFTRGLISVMENVEDADFNNDQFISWGEILKKTQEMTNKLFQKEMNGLDSYWKTELQRIRQTGQNPTHFGELPKRIAR